MAERSRSPTSLPMAALLAAGRRPEVVDVIRTFYADVDRRIAEHKPTCCNKGECCRFGQFGHRLFVTTLETVYYLAAGAAIPPITADACPHAADSQCHIRDHRPLGCRIFYCDPASGHWQGPLTEELLAVLRDLHTQLGVAYVYADWMAVLRALAGTCSANARPFPNRDRQEADNAGNYEPRP